MNLSSSNNYKIKKKCNNQEEVTHKKNFLIIKFQRKNNLRIISKFKIYNNNKHCNSKNFWIKSLK